MKPTPSDLNQTLASIIQAAAGLPRITLYPQERMRMAGSAFHEAPLLVDAVSRSLEDAPDLFAELEVDAADLRETQDRARRYASLHDSLARLARYAHDMQLFEQSRATAGAMDVVRHGRRRLEGPVATGEGRRLDAALRGPEAILAGRMESAQRPLRKGRRAARPRFTASELVPRLRASTTRGEETDPGDTVPVDPRGTPPLRWPPDTMRHRVQAIFSATLRACIDRGLLPPVEVQPQVDAPKQPAHGDWATNLALALQRPVGRPPRDIAALLVANLVDPEGLIRAAEVAGPGFINVRLSGDAWYQALGEALAASASFGRSDAGGGQRVLLEFVSANPTGPMHVGHGRGAVLGDVLGNLLEHAGYQVAREYYINDAGTQVKVLGRSVHLRYQELCGRQVSLPAGSYPGEYVIDIARALRDHHGERFLDAPEEEWLTLFCDFAMEQVLGMIRADLDAFGVRFDRWFSERTLLRAGAIERVIGRLTEQGLIYRGTLPPPKGKEAEDYEPREQLLFRSTAFGDDQDRGLQKADGTYTYFAGDVAYHEDKLARGFQTLINVWGADHTGAVVRLQAAVEALAGRKGALELVLAQMVNLYRDGKPVRMGKRSGNFVALRDVLDEVGRDAARFFFVMRSASTTLDFDLALARKQATDNPVFYVQYGHARICSILRHAREEGHPAPAFSLEVARRLERPEELDLIRRVLSFGDLVAGAAGAREPHRVVFYLQETIAAFHSYYSKGRSDAGYRVVTADRALTEARLLLCQALQLVLKSGLGLLGVSAPEHMTAPAGEEATPDADRG